MLFKWLQWCLTLCNPIDCNLSGSSVHGILQVRILVWVAMPSFFSICFIYFYSFIWLHKVLVVACRIFSCGMWDQVPWPRIEPRPPVLGAQSPSHWTNMEVPYLYVLNKFCKALCAPLGIPSCDPKVHLVNPESHWGEKQWDWKNDLIPPGSTSPPTRIIQNDVRMKFALGS